LICEVRARRGSPQAPTIKNARNENGARLSPDAAD
jgi:hypothetical protein